MAIDDLKQRHWVVLPGTLCTAAVFDGFLDALGVPPQHRHAVTLRHPSVEDYQDILAPIADGAVLCGFSLGAIVAAHLADRLSPDCMVLFGLNPFADTPENAKNRHDLARDVALMGGSSALAKRPLALHGPNAQGARETILAMADAASEHIDAHTSLALNRPGAMDALSRAQSPILILTGDEDRNVSIAQGQAAAQAAQKGHFRALSGLGHYALLEDPAFCASTVLEMKRAL